MLLGGLFKLANNRSPAEAFAGIPKKQAYATLEMQRFIQRHGLTNFQRNPHFPVNTLKVMRGAFGSPSFFVGEELFFGKDRLLDVEAEVRRQQQQQAS